MLSSADPSGKQQSAAFRRKEQLDRWSNSITDQQPGHRKETVTKVNFDRGTVFLAACSQCDKREVEELIRKGVNPNTANIDGLTALHQACIDDNISMVEFLVKHGAEINVADNEGWTPLHATASCGYIDIASYLIKKGANISACNSDGDLPIDIAEGSDMENLLAESMNSQNVNADEARNAEERHMMNDANNWLQKPDRPELENPKTGATPLHVSAAKGYHRVMMALIQAGANVNHQDFDGWTPLHGAAHWGQEDSCKILCEALCDMDIKCHSGQTSADVADESLTKLMKELHEKQKSLMALNKKDSFDDMIITKKPQIKRRRSVTRMSIDEKEKLAHTSSLEERSTALASRINEDPEHDESKDAESKVVEEPTPEAKPEEIKNEPEPVKEPVPTETKPSSTPEAKPVTSITTTENNNKEKSPEDQDAFDEDMKSTVASAVEPPSFERRAFAAIKEQGAAERSSYPMSVGRSNYIPYYKRQQMEREAKLKEEKDAANEATAGAAITPLTPSMSVLSAPIAVLTRSESDADKPPERRTSRFEAPKRDDEAEANRKIKAKRARETRRSTQGVTQDDVKAAEATLKIADTNKNGSVLRETTSSQTKVDRPSSISTSDQSEPSAATQDDKPEELSRRRAWQRSFSYDSPSSPLSPTSRVPSSPLYSPRAQDEGTRSSFRKARDTIISNSSSSSIPDTLSSSTAYSRYQRSSNENNDDRPERQRYSWRNSDRNGFDHKDAEEDNKSKEDEENDKNKPRLSRGRRQRRERRPTGVIYYDEQGNENETEKHEDENNRDTAETTTSTADSSTNSGWSSRPFTNRRYGSASDVPAQMSGNSAGDRGDRLSAYSSRFSRRQPTTGTALDSNSSELDYKKLFEESKTENEKLKTQVKGLQNEISESKTSSNRSRISSNGDSLAEKREKRALERRISELEEELKKMEVMKQDNTRLKEENGALIRVISKLSK